jgi:hypothetical protein
MEGNRSLISVEPFEDILDTLGAWKWDMPCIVKDVALVLRWCANEVK